MDRQDLQDVLYRDQGIINKSYNNFPDDLDSVPNDNNKDVI